VLVGGRTRNLRVRHGCLQATTYTIFHPTCWQITTIYCKIRL